MAQNLDTNRNETTREVYRAPQVRQAPESAYTDEVLTDLGLDLDRSTAERTAPPRQQGIMQPLVWTMMLLVVLLGGWTFLVQEPFFEPQPLDLNSFRSTPEIVLVHVTPPDVTAQVSINRWMKLRPEARLRLVENSSRIASAAGYRSITLNGTDGTPLARWLRSDGLVLLHPEPESVNVQLP